MSKVHSFRLDRLVGPKGVFGCSRQSKPVPCRKVCPFQLFVYLGINANICAIDYLEYWWWTNSRVSLVQLWRKCWQNFSRMTAAKCRERILAPFQEDQQARGSACNKSALRRVPTRQDIFHKPFWKSARCRRYAVSSPILHVHLGSPLKYYYFVSSFEHQKIRVLHHLGYHWPLLLPTHYQQSLLLIFHLCRGHLPQFRRPWCSNVLNT